MQANVGFPPIADLSSNGQNHLMPHLRPSTIKSIWRTISICSAMVAIAVTILAAMNAGPLIDSGFVFHRLRTLEGFALWCVAMGLTYSVTVFARDKADRIETPDERLSGYPKPLRFAAFFALIVAGLGLANFGLWHWAVVGLSQKQMVILAWLPMFIVSYYGMAYGNPARR